MKTFIAILISVILTSCGFVYKEKITGKFFLVAVDVMRDLSVSYYIGDDVYKGLVPGGVYEVSLNNTYIVAKCHPYIDSLHNK